MLWIEERYVRVLGKWFELDLEIHWHEWLLGLGGWKNHGTIEFKGAVGHLGPVTLWVYWGPNVDNNVQRVIDNKNIRVEKTYCDSGE